MKIPRLFRLMWKDGAFVPDGAHLASYCDDSFGEGEIVTFERHEPISDRSRGHYFACIKSAWDNIPEGDNRFPTPEALRKWALIRSGWCIKTEIVLDSPEQAALVASFTGNAESVIVVVRDNVVVKYTAKSQSAQEMGNKDFQKSKSDVLDTIAELIAVKRKRLEQVAGRVA